MRLSHRSPVKLEIDTPHGPALAHLYEAEQPAGALVLGHGAGGGFGAKDLVAATGAALEAGVSVAQVEQPYRVAGRRSPAPAKQLDAAWTAVVEHLRDGERPKCPGQMTVVESSRPGTETQKEVAKIAICSKTGDKAEVAAGLEKALARLETDSDMDATLRADLSTKLRAKIAELRAR